MPASTTVLGMVLSAMPVGDFDKRVVILTREYGKISAFAKGARRPNSALLACSQPFSFGEFNLYMGRNSYSIISADITNYFAELRTDIESVYYGSYFCEFTDYFTKENNDEKEVLKLLYQTLRALTKKTIPNPLIRVIFELKMITLEGVGPQVFYCVKCQGDFIKPRFSPISGGMLCEGCSSSDKSASKLSTSCIYAMQYIISKEIEKLYTFVVSAPVLKELQSCMERYLKLHIEHRFKSLEFIKSL
ncbi:MAG: DNA repair protein RecO [Clostridiales bacterium]|nr:DNA repair protein RecO [Clostridiales bacterium]